MCLHCWNKLIAVSSALAAAGILTCAAALLDVFMPRGSFVGFLTRMALVGCAVIAVVIGYVWVCDKCESYFSGRLDRLLSSSKPNKSDAVNPRLTESRLVSDARLAPDAPQPLARDRYTPTLRGSVSPTDTTEATAARTWHGQ